MPSKESNRIKSELLGMPFGTAGGRLRKRIMYHLAKQLGAHLCYRCGKKIGSVDDFTIDHKKPWLHNDPALFWDMKNIAFSHASCNFGTQRNSLRNRKQCPKGHPWNKENTRWEHDKDGYRHRACRACDREHWHKRKEKANRDRRVRRLDKQGLSLRQIATKVGTSHITVRNVLNGR